MLMKFPTESLFLSQTMRPLRDLRVMVQLSIGCHGIINGHLGTVRSTTLGNGKQQHVDNMNNRNYTGYV